MPIKIPVEKTKTVEEGKHAFQIVEVSERTEPYHYVDVHFRLDGTDGVVVKKGFSAKITDGTALGKLLMSASIMLAVDTVMDVEGELVNKTGTLMTINKVSEKGCFARIVDDSIKFN